MSEKRAVALVVGTSGHLADRVDGLAAARDFLPRDELDAHPGLDLIREFRIGHEAYEAASVGLE
jgi:hypothetical protein